MAAADARMTGRLLVVGELCIDLIVRLGDGPIRFGQHEQLVPSTTLTMGSSSAITACGTAALGVPTSMIGVCGADEFGDYLLRELTGRNIDVSAIRIDPTVSTGSSTHLTRPDGDRAILTSRGSIGSTTAADVSERLLSGAAHLHGGSYFLQEALWPDASALWARARAAGLTTSLDGNFDPTEQWDSGIFTVLEHCDVFFANEQELCGITGAATLDSAIDTALQRMPDGAVVVAKEGAQGASVVGRGVRVHASTPELPGDLVDTVGAGDSLAGGFIAGLLDGLSYSDALRLGVACGTASTRGAGGVDAQPTRRTADALAATVTVTG